MCLFARTEGASLSSSTSINGSNSPVFRYEYEYKESVLLNPKLNPKFPQF